jgi:hypothetical protein
VNLFTFVSVFYFRYVSFREFVQSIHKERIQNVTLGLILEETTKHSYLINRATNALENMFTSYLLLGFLALTLQLPIVKDSPENLRKFPWQIYAVYTSSMILFWSLVIAIQGIKSDLSQLIRTQPFVKKFLRRYTPEEITTRFDQDIHLILLNLQEENASTLDWFVLDNLLQDQWMGFKIMGIPMNDVNLIKRVIFLFFMFFTVQKTFF